MDIPPIPARTPFQSPVVQRPSEEKSKLQESVNLKLTAKGYYYWEINAFGDLDDAMVAKIVNTDSKLRGEFPNNVNSIYSQSSSDDSQA